MQIKFKSEPINGPVKPATVIFLTQGEEDPFDNRKELASFRILLNPHLTSGVFKACHLDVLTLFFAPDTWLVVVGLGKEEALTEAKLMEAGAKAAKEILSLKIKEAFVLLPKLQYYPSKVLELLTTGLLLGISPRFSYKSTPADHVALRTITIQSLSSQNVIDRAKSYINRAEAMAEAQLNARRLTDQPADRLTPEAFAQEAVALGLQKKLKVTVWDPEKLEIEKAGGVLAVGKGSVNSPRLVIMEYQGAAGLGAQAPKVLIGKGVTFDSGGLCLKPGENMALMKTDMAGAAVVLSVMSAAATLKLAHRLVAIIPLAENMPSGSAYRPGDIVKMLSGSNVEIVNTDAEGRLLLADALALALRYHPKLIVDVATLTGACQVALGDQVAGLFCDDVDLRTKLIEAGQSVGEALWQLPLFDAYDENLKSEIADFSHAASRAGGAINAALFLRRFVKNVPWAHIDIAGTSRCARKRPSCPEGPTGFAVRTLIKYLTNLT
ncbi:MAG: leucyl aminopeptidase [Deltaproteobacteria bacterium]|jgi:leucyl aminopeptidase|nr:leucyl aminopeptidase [Deltaproteobacteria bacterium]